MTILYSIVSVRSIHSHRMKGDTPIALNVHQNEKIDIDKVTSAPKGQFILNGCSFLLLMIDNLSGMTIFFLSMFFFPFLEGAPQFVLAITYKTAIAEASKDQ